ncbi:MAG: ABC transporter permease, partial [Acidimicrobiales bacterium]|nr:ABC transporter permease [Acidimicrobiales bacterium]
TRKLRAGLSALGIAIGVAAIVAVLGLSASSQAGLLNEINRLGTNLLTVSNGQTFTGAPAELPTTAPAMIGRISGMQQVQATGTISGANAYRNPYIPPVNTNALTVQAASLDLLPVLATTSPKATTSTLLPPRNPSPLSAPLPPNASGSTASTPANASGSAVNGSTSPASSTLQCSPLPSTPPSSSATPPPRSTSASTVTPPPSTSAPRTTESKRSTTFWPPPPTPRTPTR